MSARWKLKIIMVGSSQVGKTSFIKSCVEEEGEDGFRPINPLGVSFDILNSYLNNGDNCSCVVWDIKTYNHYLFIFPMFFRGAAGGLLFFDLSNHQSFEDLNIWIRLVKKIRGNIPLILIGTKADLQPQVLPEEINEFIRNNGILSYYSTSIHRTSKRDTALKQLVSNIIENRLSNEKNQPLLEPIQESLQDILNQISGRTGGRGLILSNLYYDQYDRLSDEEKSVYNKFIKSFSDCPICKKKNHINHLRKFYFSKNKENNKLKKRILKLLEESYNFDELYHNSIILGIPCCACFNQFFH